MLRGSYSTGVTRTQSGFVLVSVLMLGVLLISCATAFTWFVRSQARTIGSERQDITSRSMAYVIVNSVMSTLSEIAQQVDYDSPTQRWYQPFVLPIDDLEVWVVQVTPLDDKIPIKNLFLPDNNTLRREFSTIWQEMWEKLGHRELEQIVLDFLDRNDKPRVGGIERGDFINRGPYDISELLVLSHDITPDMLYGSEGVMGIADYCTVYSDGKININVAPVHVMELLPGLDVGGLAARIAQERKEHPLEKFDDIQKIPGASPKTSTQLTNIVGFKSRYFRMDIDCIDTDRGGKSFSIIFDRTTRQIVRWEES